MRIAIALALLASPAAAWEFSSSPICTLSHDTDSGSIVVTYDASIPEYAVSITRDAAWPDAAAFAMEFAGGQPLTIQTPRHTLSDDGLTLTVRDRGFGNVLDGLEFNQAARASSGQADAIFPLDGIADPMAAFRRCPELTLS